MIQLSYQPAFDPFHTIFRMLRVLALHDSKPVRIETLRILDFYLLFPFRISDIRLIQTHGRFRSLSKIYEKTRPYGDQPEGVTIFNRMEPIQSASLSTLATSGFIDFSKLQDGWVQKAEIVIPEPLLGRIVGTNAEQKDLMQFLLVLSEYELRGTAGLKARTGLMEYRYDTV